MSQREHSFNPEMSGAESMSCDGLRQALGRPDLDDETLRDAVRDVVMGLTRFRSLDGKDDLIARVSRGELDDDRARAVVSCLCIPASRAPLLMPLQVLEVPHVPLLARLFAFTRNSSRVRVRQRVRG
ncbi:hypothetical protein [Breoghania sp.]|uniref:hypothetical protein n=1 Tax=Breoghania sp. TaxID=2065378 RepID=UPI00262B0DEE|nr:hypothetical protein [Breoghania sp.]MDJ0932222.1 hypothetical protein [Breoghania sp.]